MTAKHGTSQGDTVTEHRLNRSGRTVAWTQFGVPEGRPVVRFPGTPSCRVHLPLDRRAWAERGLRCLTTERPGFGASTRLPGRRFREHADDVAAILDAEGIDRVHITGISGGGPHALAFAAFHPERVNAASVVSGDAPATEEEAADLVEVNARFRRLEQAGDVAALTEMYATMQRAILSDPRGALRTILADAAEGDRAVMEDSDWLEMTARALTEALKGGPEGWMDEGIALASPWDFDPAEVRASVTWWHSARDRNALLSAAERVVGRLPDARLEPLEGGHFAPGRDSDILDDLLKR